MFAAKHCVYRESKVKFIKLCARNFRPISNFLGVFPKYSTPVIKDFTDRETEKRC